MKCLDYFVIGLEFLFEPAVSLHLIAVSLFKSESDMVSYVADSRSE